MLEIWIPPNEWTGPDPALYFSFNTLEGLTRMEGTEQRNFSAIVSGKVGVYKPPSGTLPDESNIHVLNTGLRGVLKFSWRENNQQCPIRMH